MRRGIIKTDLSNKWELFSINKSPVKVHINNTLKKAMVIFIKVNNLLTPADFGDKYNIYNLNLDFKDKTATLYNP